MDDGINAPEKLDVGFPIVRQELTADPEGGGAAPNNLGRGDVDLLQLFSDLGILLAADAQIAEHLTVQRFDHFGCHGHLYGLSLLVAL